MKLNALNLEMKNVNGTYLTSGLFFETDQREPKGAVYTFKDEDLKHNGKKYISLKAIYMQFDHVPEMEYDFANQYLGGWEHWQKICESPATAPYIEKWREELAIKIRSESIKGVIQQSRTEKGFQAAKWLAEGGYSPKKRGRPSKEEVEREARIQAGVDENIDDMWKRIN